MADSIGKLGDRGQRRGTLPAFPNTERLDRGIPDIGSAGQARSAIRRAASARRAAALDAALEAFRG